jgi:hypothetical protein
MTNTIFSGKCPQCKLLNDNVDMRQNNYPFWECPKCELQILVEDEKALILQNRGKGEFTYNIIKFNSECVLAETGSDSYPNGKEIINTVHLAKYLKNKVQQSEEFSYTKLINSYVNYKFDNQPEDNYLKQSVHFKINFEDSSIQEKLAERDRVNNQNPLYAHSRLYRFLKVILEKYYKIDSSWLPEMGMSKIEHYLSLKHFPSDKRKLINSNPVFVKQSLKELAVDLISIIYLNESILLSYDPIELVDISNEIKL